MRRAVLIRLALVAWFEMGVVLVTIAPGCGKDRANNEVETPVRLVEVQAVRCQHLSDTCCLPPDGEYQSYYYPEANEIQIPVNTTPPSCAQYARDHYLDCQYKSAEVYRETDEYVNCCEVVC